MHESMKALLEFWFNSADPAQMATHRKEWWIKEAEFDRRIHEEFNLLFEQADQGLLDAWKDTPLGCVALVILLDQFPRNMFRNTAKAFASDKKALQLTRHVLDKSFDKNLPLGPRLFLYLPLEHSEDLQDQTDCVDLMRQLGDDDYLNFAIKHRDIIEKFGRFPHRNNILGRVSSTEETAFLEMPGSSF